MSDEPKAPWTKAVPQLLGIAVLAVVFVACLGDGRSVESPFLQAGNRLRTGMSIDEAFAVTEVGEPDFGDGSVRYTNYTWLDERRKEVLSLHFETRWDLAGDAIDRLTEWSVESADRPR
jgi:hypothetical protein